MDMTIGDMLEMQEKLYKAYGEPFGWMDYTPKNAAMHWLYMLGEAGEVVDALKKNSLDQLMQEGEPRIVFCTHRWAMWKTTPSARSRA